MVEDVPVADFGKEHRLRENVDNAPDSNAPFVPGDVALVGKFLHARKVAHQVDIAEHVGTEFHVKVVMLDIGLLAIIVFAGKVVEAVTRTEERHTGVPNSCHGRNLLDTEAPFRTDTRSRAEPENTAHKERGMNPGCLGTGSTRRGTFGRTRRLRKRRATRRPKEIFKNESTLSSQK